jgi:hypothetical protein
MAEGKYPSRLIEPNISREPSGPQIYKRGEPPNLCNEFALMNMPSETLVPRTPRLEVPEKCTDRCHRLHKLHLVSNRKSCGEDVAIPLTLINTSLSRIAR